MKVNLWGELKLCDAYLYHQRYGCLQEVATGLHLDATRRRPSLRSANLLWHNISIPTAPSPCESPSLSPSLYLAERE